MTLSQFIDYLTLHNKKHLIFDFDETLCTLRIDWSYWMRDIYHVLHLYDPLYSTKYITIQSAMNGMVKLYGKDLRDKLIDVNYIAERDHFTGYIKQETALEFLQQSAKHAKIYMWTSNDRKTVEPIMKELRIYDLFETIVANDDVMYIKPDPDGFSHINKAHHSKAEFLMIGDSDNDEGAASSAGIDFMRVSTLNKSI